jgi:uncharacterized protein (DUF433 family)
MPLVLEAPALPLHTDADGVVRVGKTRVTLDTVVAAYNAGATAEQIALDYPVLALADVHAVITFYLSRRAEVDAHLAGQRADAEALRQQLTANYDGQEIRKRLLARRNGGGDAGAATAGR